jgi:hypothetical protein
MFRFYYPFILYYPSILHYPSIFYYPSTLYYPSIFDYPSTLHLILHYCPSIILDLTCYQYLMANISYITVPRRRVDLSDPADSPSGSRFMPDSPTPEPQPMRAWSDKTREAFDKYL